MRKTNLSSLRPILKKAWLDLRRRPDFSLRKSGKIPGNYRDILVAGLGFLGGLCSGVKADESPQSFIQKLETQGIEKMSLEDMSQVHDLNKRLEGVIDVEQKLFQIQKLRQERRGELSPRMPSSEAPSPALERPVLPVLPVSGYAVQKVFKKEGLFQAILLDAQGRHLDVKTGTLLPSGERVRILGKDRIVLLRGRKEQTLPFASERSLEGIKTSPARILSPPPQAPLSPDPSPLAERIAP